LFDDVDTSLAGVAQYAGANPPAALTSGLEGVIHQAKRAQVAFESGDDNGIAIPLEGALASLRALRSQLATMGLSDAGRYEIDFRLRNKERDYEDALLAALGLVFDAQADDGLVVPGQPI